MGVTALVQSSTATSLMTSSFVGQGLIPCLPPWP
jgi:phosphate:Na+ symporter